MVCAAADCIPRTAPAVARMAPTERKALTEKYMRPSLGFRIRSNQAERDWKVPAAHFPRCQARWNDFAGRELQLLVGRFFRVTVTCAALRLFICFFSACVVWGGAHFINAL